MKIDGTIFLIGRQVQAILPFTRLRHRTGRVEIQVVTIGPHSDVIAVHPFGGKEKGGTQRTQYRSGIERDIICAIEILVRRVIKEIVA